ncbi:iron complex outermembrane receptor protein [Tenacibaculum adriaticum]|uniref:Iron complex outermembrane receptor protein n=1 Tax=Tenacibaculum adriaticum TaxID=413713 RepID=A0A5S5DTA4_9FLAO|nr:TonB-dependent receptor [Tenacibaculum adriaticum]TYP98914.1 iron complex outermembrane receptor protein [Tenacibaculum adriaticum]
MKKLTLLLFLTMCSSFMWAQTKITGTIKDTSNEPLPGANVLEKGTTNGTTSDFNGNFSLTVEDGATLIVSFSGFETQEIAVNGKTSFNIVLKEGLELEEVVITGSRTPARSNTSSPLPVDIVSSKDLQSTGQATFDKALQYKIPSFNTVQTPVNDATSLLDPYEIRNMGPSRTLILVNGKRKNLSALLYTQTSPGRGETGADISGIPTDAIKTVQVLRDGASAQYGSDAIAGVINIILKEDTKNGSATFRSGITSEGDGEMLGVSINNGTTIGEDKGFINYTADFSKVALSNRPGTVNADGEAADFVYTNPTSYSSYLDADGRTLGGVDLTGFTVPQAVAEFENNYMNTPEYATNLAAINAGNAAGKPFVDEFLSRNPDANNINGSPKTAAAKFSINGGYDVSDESQVYFNAAYVYKKVNSYANYRTPYWRTVESMPYLADFFPGGNPNTDGGYDGYVPTFEGDLSDYNATLGIRSKINDWNVDVSFTTGGNSQTYKVNNSHNRNVVYSPSTWIDANNNGTVDPGELTEGSELYRENSKRSFDPGGTAFSHNVGNLDISRILSEKVSIGFGAEFRSELFEIIEGELSSYDGGGADSFAGNSPENSGKFSRYNLGGYFSLDWDISKAFLVSGTARAENYSDFGSTFVWKLSSRYKLSDKYTLRGSLSTGFRAPTLHQIYTQKAQYSFVPGQGIQVGGLINNVSSQAQLLGIPKLDAEESTNFTVGFGGKVNKHVSFTVDYYNIAVKDRIVLSTEIGKTATDAVGNSIGNTALDQVLNANNLSDLSFFVNALDTKTSGLDVVLGYKDIAIGSGQLGFNLSGNYTIQNERDGEVKNPKIVADADQSVVNETQEALFFTSRPKTKWILGTTYDIGKFGLSLNNTYFGKTTFKQQGMSSDLRTEFIPKVVTDLGINYNATDKLTIALNVNNLLNVLPEWEFKAENAAGQALINDTTPNWYGITPIQEQSNLITFNQRYSQMTYDGYHFSQLGTMFSLSVNYQF